MSSFFSARQRPFDIVSPSLTQESFYSDADHIRLNLRRYMREGRSGVQQAYPLQPAPPVAVSIAREVVTVSAAW